jgi:hypothetical protein
MTGGVIPFPLIRRRPFVLRAAARMASSSPRTAEKLLAATLNQQASAMARKGIAAEMIARELRALECAIRAELWRHILMPDGAV